jgi:hypothetical protein
VGGVDKKHQLLQMYPMEEKRMNKAILNHSGDYSIPLPHIKKNVHGKNCHLKSKIDFIGGLLTKYSKAHTMPGHHGYSIF